MHRYKTPTVLQMEATECGAVAIAIILGFYDKYISLEELRSRCRVSRDGSNAQYMLEAMRYYGMDAKAATTEDSLTLASLNQPVIVFWEFNHFIVVENITDKFAYVNDPATGPRKIPKNDFDKSFTGLFFLVEPGPNFQPSGEKPSAIKMLKSHFTGALTAFYYITLATLALIIPALILAATTKVFIDDVLISGYVNWINPLLTLMLLTALVQVGLLFVKNLYLLRMHTQLNLKRSSVFFWHILRLPIDFFAQRYKGDIVTRVLANERVASLLSIGFTTSVVDILSIIFYLIIMFFFSIPLTLVVLVAVALNVTVFVFVSRKIADITFLFLQEQGKLTSYEMMGIQSIDSLKAMACENDFFRRWAGQHAKIINSVHKLAIYNQVLNLAPSLIFGLLTVAIVGSGAWLILAGKLSAGTLIAFQILISYVVSPIQGLIGLCTSFQTTRGDLLRLDDVLRSPQDQRLDEEGKKKLPAEAFDDKISLDQIGFHYVEGRPILEDITFTIQPGSQVAIVGATGCGKSTLAKLISGLYQPQNGDILLGNTAINDIDPEDFAQHFSFVDQDITLFSGTVFENLSLWNTNKDYNYISKAMQDACIENDVIARGGMHTEITEAGENFSFGQRQRLEIARALSNNPRILILDEATSSLDAELENQIYANIKRRGCTQIIIAHRLSAIRDCDEIIVLHEGKIYERGKHDDLIKNEGLYYKLFTTE